MDAPATSPNESASLDVLDAVIVGSGFAGLCMAIRLQQRGLRYRVLEQAASLGGTWRDNRYPGAACDIPSNLYCFSFAPNPDWSRAYPDQAEIEAYLNRCADHFGVRARVRCNHAVTAARFDAQRGSWQIEVNGGEHRFAARALVLATGGLSKPKMPEIPGLAEFGGALFHTARWPAELTLTGKRVGLIGTGASAIQVLPAIAGQAAHVHVFQRTPAWVIPKWNPSVPRWRQALYRHQPWLQALVRRVSYLRHEVMALAFTRAPILLKALELLPRALLRWQVRDPALRARLTPSYRVGCKRVLLASDFYPALCRPDVHLHTHAIERIDAHGVVAADGTHTALDVLVACTGFEAAEIGAPFPIAGLDGRDLDHEWRDGQQAYLGTSVSGFPNLFIMTGPNTALGHNSMVYMIEAQSHYVLDAIAQLAQRPGSALDVDAQAQRRYNEKLQTRLARTVWNTGGCRSWYLARNGLNTTLWPDFTFVFRYKLRRFDARPYRWLT
jgi:cation diffusion facilitator CzcD-associated flavoprotein CzcO